MRDRLSVSFLVLAAVLIAAPAGSQNAAPGEADPGVRPTRLIDRAEVRVSRVELAPGATRQVHTHTDVQFHLWVPLSGSLELSTGTGAPVAAAAGQAFFFARNSPHGFKNVGTTPAAVLEVFVKDGATAMGPDAASALALAYAAAAPVVPW